MKKALKSLYEYRIGIAIAFFVVITFVIGEYTLFHRRQYNKEITELKKEIQSLRELNAKELELLEALENSNEALENFAREKYGMVRAGEEVFIIKENEHETK